MVLWLQFTSNRLHAPTTINVLLRAALGASSSSRYCCPPRMLSLTKMVFASSMSSYRILTDQDTCCWLGVVTGLITAMLCNSIFFLLFSEGVPLKIPVNRHTSPIKDNLLKVTMKAREVGQRDTEHDGLEARAGSQRCRLVHRILYITGRRQPALFRRREDWTCALSRCFSDTTMVRRITIFGRTSTRFQFYNGE